MVLLDVSRSAVLDVRGADVECNSWVVKSILSSGKLVIHKP